MNTLLVRVVADSHANVVSWPRLWSLSCIAVRDKRSDLDAGGAVRHDLRGSLEDDDVVGGLRNDHKK
jgi:hypothetical protein